MPAAIRAFDGHRGVRVLAGIECDILADGTLDLDDDCLAALDIVVASVHSAFNQERAQITERVLQAMSNPHVDVLGHPTGRMLLRRDAYPLDIAVVVAAAARNRRGARDQLAAPSTRFVRRARDAGARGRRPHRHFERLPFPGGHGVPSVGRDRSPTRMARTRTRPEHASIRRTRALAAATQDRAHGLGLTAYGPRLWALGFGLWALGFGLWALGFGLWALGSRLSTNDCRLTTND